MTTSLSPRATSVLVLLAAGVVLIAAVAWMTRQPNASANTAGGPTSAGQSSGITVVGSGEVSGTPDTLRLNLSVTTRDATVAAALAKGNATTAKVQDSLRDSGVAAKDLQTSGLSIQPEYGSGDAVKRPKIIGYSVQQRLSATLRDIGRSGAAISGAAKAGGDAVSIDGISLDLEESSSLAKEARDEAVSEAKAKAEQYARASGRSLGQVVSISESTDIAPPQPYAMDAQAARTSSLSVPVAPGSQAVNVTVTVVYSFG